MRQPQREDRPWMNCTDQYMDKSISMDHHRSHYRG